MQVMAIPDDCHSLAEQLAERHSEACQQQIKRLEVAYQAFAAACGAADGIAEPLTNASNRLLPETGAELGVADQNDAEDGGEDRSGVNAGGPSVSRRLPQERGPAEQALRQRIEAYFESDRELEQDADMETGELPLKAPAPLLGADARALIVQLAKSHSSLVWSSSTLSFPNVCRHPTLPSRACLKTHDQAN